MKRQGRLFQREIDAAPGLRRPLSNPLSPDRYSGQLYQGPDGNWYYPDGRPFTNVAPRSGVNACQPYANVGQPYLATDGNWYYPDGRLYTGAAQPTGNANQPYQAVDGNWYYPDGRPYNAAQPAGTGQPYLAVDGKWYYPDGRPYTPSAAEPAAPTSAPATARAPATPAPNVIPDQRRADVVARNLVRTRLSAALSTVREKLAQELPQAIQEQIDKLESGLRPALFSNADEAAVLGIYKKSFTEDTAQYELVRKMIRSLEAEEFAQRLSIDQVVDPQVPIFLAKLKVSAKLNAFKKTLLEGRSAAELDQAEKGLLETYQQVAGDSQFTSLKVPGADQLSAGLAALRSLFEVRQKLGQTQEAAGGSLVTLDKRFWIVSYPGLPKDTIHAIVPQICLWGMGTGTIGVREAGLQDLGVPLLNRAVDPLPEIPRPPAPSGAIVYNAKQSPAPVHYVADRDAYELKPGESRTHQVTADSRISYNRGENLGNQEYQLTSGTFRFAIEDRAWQLTKPTFAVLIDNSANGSDFQCNIDGQPRVIPARKTFEVKSDYPIAIRFDRGDGQPASCKLLDETPQVTVGVRPDSATLDLFAGSSKELCVQPQAADSVASVPKT